jgi:SAM-dependent methyltransferase
MVSDSPDIRRILQTYGGRVLDVGGERGTVAYCLPRDAEYTNIREDQSEHLPFASEHFDVVLREVSRSDPPAKTLGECARVLRHGGRLLLVLERSVVSETQVVEWLRDTFVLSRRLLSEDERAVLEFVKESGRDSRCSDRSAVNMGDLRRVTPIAGGFGYDRGQPIDRYFIERFIARHASDITGDVLEIGDATYTTRYGCPSRYRSHVLHKHPGAPGSTMSGDLSNFGYQWSASFDCIICTQTLQFIFEVGRAVETLHRLLRPGGVVLLTVPGTTQTDDQEWAPDWCWSFTPRSLNLLFAGPFTPSLVDIAAHGNVLVATSFLQGLAAQDLSQGELDFADPAYPFLVTARAVKRR